MINSLITEASEVRNQPSKNGWLSQTAADYLLAETALYMGDYKKAAEYADDVIEQGDDSKIGGESYSRLWRTEAMAAESLPSTPRTAIMSPSNTTALKATIMPSIRHSPLRMRMYARNIRSIRKTRTVRPAT